MIWGWSFHAYREPPAPAPKIGRPHRDRSKIKAARKARNRSR